MAPPISQTDNGSKKLPVGSAIQVPEVENKLAESHCPDDQVSFDGGCDAWLTVVGGWLAAFCTFGAASSFGVYQAIYTLQNTSTPSNISWIGSLQFFLTFSVGLPAGKLFDAGYFHHIQVGGALLCVFSWFMLSLADTTKYYQIMLSQGVGVGLGSGLIYSPVLSVQAHHWKRRRALAMGIVLSGSSFGGIVLPIMLNRLLHSSVGFAWGVRASAFLILGLLTIANLCMRTRYPTSVGGVSPPKHSIADILHDLPHWVTVIGSTLTLFGLYTPYFYLQLFVNIHGLSPTLAFYSVATLNASSFFGRTMLNFAADNVGHFNVIALVSIVSAGLVFLMFSATNTGGVIIFAILYGFFSGGFASLLPPALATLSRDLSEVGYISLHLMFGYILLTITLHVVPPSVRIGSGYFLASFGLLAGSPIAGVLLRPGFRWYRLIVFSGAMMIAGASCMLAARQIVARRKGSQRV